MAKRDLDIVLYGATGFVGTLTARYLAGRTDGLRVALAGRSRERLERLRAELGTSAEEWEVIEVHAHDSGGLRVLAGRTKVLATTVGPYAVHGKDVVRACAETGTHYADLTGEVLFVRWSVHEVGPVAEASGARIVHACGYDSVPSDLGVLLLARRAAADGAGTLGDTVLAVKSAKGGFSGGTVHSARNQAIVAAQDPAARRVLSDPHALSPRRQDEPKGGPRRSTGLPGLLRKLVPVDRDPQTGRWNGPFVMAGFNTRIVRLSNTLTQWSYGRDLRYREVVDFGSGPLSPLLAGGMAIGLAGGLAGLSWGPTRAVLDRVLPKPGEGPSEAQMAAGRFRMEIRSTTTTGAKYVATVAAPFDPGYSGTAVMLGESVLSLLQDGDRLPDRAGVLTPATALGDVLVKRLRDQGFTLEVERLT
ncbi:saccharopine dehydrogenase NADP-binding domain-containing protein [Intrasporangium calvum]|uniref:Saccharopine dehydrogenase NADP-binding domain-containing protein n=1 Tax=Intrasporangium calvum TaxID=53358 RepID=A0ABT5GCG6_9MICO|nr:saccharopine dehydrogenase NADP-binding domain-containing protein [Intrasporangium calvum]MDC5695914.1 saccharopine dehydrogenase NADP-binding domain-containing protein [Intrasporangium calvum]